MKLLCQEVILCYKLCQKALFYYMPKYPWYTNIVFMSLGTTDAIGKNICLGKKPQNSPGKKKLYGENKKIFPVENPMNARFFFLSGREKYFRQRKKPKTFSLAPFIFSAKNVNTGLRPLATVRSLNLYFQFV